MEMTLEMKMVVSHEVVNNLLMLNADGTVKYSGVTLNVALPDMNNYATLGVMLY